MPIRLRTIRFLECSGVTQASVIRCVGIPYSSWKYFLNGQRRLPPKYYRALDGYLAKHGF